MKNLYTLKTLITLLLITVMHTAWAATGPSDPTTAPPTSASDVNKILCAGATISISGPQNGGVDYPAYQWYKLDASGAAQLIAGAVGRTYTEPTTDAGYYTYKVVTVNANQCTSPSSDAYKIYVLPTLSASIASSTGTICAGETSTILTATATSIPTNFTYNYQWTRNGSDIAGATSSTYTLAEPTAATITMGIKITYALNSTCAATATTDIIVAPIPTQPSITAN